VGVDFNYESLKLFYIGKQKQLDGSFVPFVYKNKDLLTHAAIIGMTGSGKTGLGITLLEEAAIDNIPSIIIDPKGDMTNLLLTFVSMSAEEFKPWIEEQEAQNSGLSVDEMAAKTASMWKSGIEGDFQSLDRVKKLKDSADFTIYTPASDAGVQVSLLSSFDAPSREVLEDSELLNSLISSTVSSIVALMGEKWDENSKEVVLLSNIFLHNFYESKTLSLEELINQIINPPFDKIGVFALESFFSSSDRMKLALKLNSIIANPSFKSWLEGERLDISKMLYDENGKARVAIFSIAHLNDTQRMFFVSMLLNQFLSWMRHQEGTTSLKALLYMDEIFGYFPPLANPPSKQPMLTLLKQARSFGIGIVLSTQNPVDIDYKGLSNIGTWFLGRLQTKQDIAKVIDGLSSANATLDKKAIEDILTNLPKRNFLLSNINEDNLEVIESRWALSYLKGPIPKDGIKRLMESKKIAPKAIKETPNSTKSDSKPMVASSITQKYLYASQNEKHYMVPNLLLSCEVGFVNTSKAIDKKESLSFIAELSANMREIDFDLLEEFKDEHSKSAEPTNSTYYELPLFVQNDKDLKLIEKHFADFIYRTQKLKLYKVAKLRLESKEDESFEEFKIRVQDRLREAEDVELDKLKLKYQKLSDSLEQKIFRLKNRLTKAKQQANATTTETIISIGSSLLGAFLGKSSTTSSMGKVLTSTKGINRTIKSRGAMGSIEGELEMLESQRDELQNQLQVEADKIGDSFLLSNYDIEEVFVKPRKTDIYGIKLELLWREI
jgi:hypothetical protein